MLDGIEDGPDLSSPPDILGLDSLSAQSEKKSAVALPPRRKRASTNRAARGQRRPELVAVDVAETGTESSDHVPSHTGKRPSSIEIPDSLAERVEKFLADSETTRGALVVLALETTLDDLPALLAPAGKVAGGKIGGRLFAERTAPQAPTSTGGMTKFNYRLSDEDFAVVDQLRDELGARSRVHLITVALTEFLSKHP